MTPYEPRCLKSYRYENYTDNIVYRIVRFNERFWTTAKNVSLFTDLPLSPEIEKNANKIQKRTQTLPIALPLRSCGKTNCELTGAYNRRLTWIKWVWLDAVDHVFVALKNHHQFSAVLVPYKDAPTIAATENVLLAPEISFLDLQRRTYF